LVLGVWLAVLPYLGFPYSFKSVLVSATGLAVLYIGYMLHGETQQKTKKKEVFENFSENSDFVEENPSQNQA